MPSNLFLTPEDARKLIHDALLGAGTSLENGEYFTEAILDTELSGLEGQGFYWLQYYCAHLLSGKVDGKVTPKINAVSKTCFLEDALHGFGGPKPQVTPITA